MSASLILAEVTTKLVKLSVPKIPVVGKSIRKIGLLSVFLFVVLGVACATPIVPKV